MAETMSASQCITDGQIDDATAKFRDTLCKHREEFGSEPSQEVLSLENIGTRLLQPFRDLVEVRSNLITRSWTADRSLSSMDLLKATGRKLYVNDRVVASMPRGTGTNGRTRFFKLDLSKRDGFISNADLDNEYDLRGMDPEFPDTLAEINRADPAFADAYPNATQWMDSDGKYCCALFYRWDGGRRVNVCRDGRGWDGRCWFAGRSK
jgi:hypothetical protein